MQRFIARENIKRYKQMLSETTDEGRKAMLRQLLADEEQLLRELDKAQHGGAGEVPPPKAKTPVL